MAIESNESLELIVAADADKAGKEIDELVGKLDKVIDKLEKSKDASKKHLYLDGLKDARKDLDDLGKGLPKMKSSKFGSPIDSNAWKKAKSEIDDATERFQILKHSAEGMMWIAQRPTVSKANALGGADNSDRFSWMNGQRERHLNSLKQLYHDIGVLQEKIDGSKTGQLSFAKGTDKVRRMKMELFAAQNEADRLRRALGDTNVPSGLIHNLKTAAKGLYMSAVHTRLLNKESKRAKASVIDMSRALSLMAFRFAVRTVIRLTKEGLQNLAQYSRETDNIFNGAMSKMKSGVTQLKNAFATAIAPIIQAAQPYVNQIINMIIGAFNKISLLMASLLGQETFYRALPVVEDYAASLDKASKKAKELNKQLMGIDELTILKDNSDTGANDGNADPSKMFTIEKVSNYQKSADQMANGFRKIVGYAASIGGAITAWKLSNAVTSLFKLENGFTRAAGAALTIGGAMFEVQGIIDAVKNGLSKTNFAEIIFGGGALVSGAAMIGKTLGSGLLGGAIGGIVAGIPMFVTGVFDAIKNGLDKLNAILIPAGATMAGAGVGAVIGMLGGPIGAGIGALIGLAVGALTDLGILIYQKWDEITKWFVTNVTQPIGNFFSNLWGTVKADFSVFAAEFSNGWKNFTSKMKKEVVEPLKEAWRIMTSAVGGYFSNLWDAIRKGASSAFNTVISRIESGLNKIIAGVNTFLSGFNKIISWAGSIVGKNWSGVGLVKTVSLGRINAYADGGVIEDGLFTMNHGEIAGRFDNGQTVVANNQMIVDGIADGVYRAVSAAMRENGGERIVKVFLDGKEIKTRESQLSRAYGW